MNVASPHERELARRIKPNPIDRRAAGYDVIDTDFHFVPDWEALRRYIRWWGQIIRPNTPSASTARGRMFLGAPAQRLTC